jgi:hypothetical protein
MKRKARRCGCPRRFGLVIALVAGMARADSAAAVDLFSVPAVTTRLQGLPVDEEGARYLELRAAMVISMDLCRFRRTARLAGSAQSYWRVRQRHRGAQTRRPAGWRFRVGLRGAV